jgi:hypothetical protein
LATDQRDLEITIPANDERHLDPNMQIHIMGQLLGADGAVFDAKDYTAGVNNMLCSLFEQCNKSLNGTLITHSLDNYNYRALLETLLTYGSDAAESHFTNANWYWDNGDI